MPPDQEFRAYVRDDLAEIKTEVKDISARLRGMEKAVAIMQTENRLRVGLYGFIGGFIPSLGLLIYFLVN